MTFDQIWNQLIQKQPRIADGDSVVEFTSVNLRKLLKQVYEQGRKSAESKPDPLGPFRDAFGMT